MTQKTWAVELEQDENGQLILPFPPDLLEQLGWKEGTDIQWIENDNGKSYTLVEKKHEQPSQDDGAGADPGAMGEDS